MDLTQMTEKELYQLKNKRYEEAIDNKTIEKLSMIARQLGTSLSVNYGPKYIYDSENVQIYVDDYGHYMTVRDGDKLVCSTHPCDRFIIVGEWTSRLLNVYPQAFEVYNKKL